MKCDCQAPQDVQQTYRNVLAAQVLALINAVLCERYLAHCPHTPDLSAECRQVRLRHPHMPFSARSRQANVRPIRLVTSLASAVDGGSSDGLPP